MAYQHVLVVKSVLFVARGGREEGAGHEWISTEMTRVAYRLVMH